MLLGCAKVYLEDAKAGVDTEQSVCRLAEMESADPWEGSMDVDLSESDLEKEPARESASFGNLPAGVKPKIGEVWKKAFGEQLYRSVKVELFRSPGLKQVSKPGESEKDFRLRIGQAGRETRDAMVEKLRLKYAPKFASLQERIRRAEQAVEREKEQASQSKMQTVISVGGALLGAFLGRKVMSAGNIGRATTAVRGAGRAYKESQDIDRAGENVDAVKQQLADLQAQFQAEADAITGQMDPTSEQLETVTIKPKKTNITVRSVTVAWAPHWRGADGQETSAWE